MTSIVDPGFSKAPGYRATWMGCGPLESIMMAALSKWSRQFKAFNSKSFGGEVNLTRYGYQEAPVCFRALAINFWKMRSWYIVLFCHFGSSESIWAKWEGGYQFRNTHMDRRVWEKRPHHSGMKTAWSSFEKETCAKMMKFPNPLPFSRGEGIERRSNGSHHHHYQTSASTVEASLNQMIMMMDCDDVRGR